MTPDEFFDARGPANPVVNGRYRLPDPETGRDRTWTRASNYGYPIADQWGLTRWRHRQIMVGLSRRPDLLRLLSVLDPEDVGKIDEAVATALEVAGVTESANLGTAIHEALALADRGQDYPEWAQPHVEGYRAELARHGLEVVLVERQVINRPLGAAGRPDRVYRTADGRYVVGDLKPDTHLDLAAGEFACQVAVYATATHLQADDGTFRPLDAPIDQDEAVIVAVNRETGATSIYTLDLRLSRYGANLAEQVRGWHRMTKNLLLPYVRPAADVTPQLERSLTVVRGPEEIGQERHLQAVHASSAFVEAVKAEVGQQAAEHVEMLTGFAKAAGALPEIGSDPVDEGAQPDSGPAAVQGGDLKTVEELMRLDKPALQQYGRERSVTDLAHNRKVLIEIFTKAGIVAGSTAVLETTLNSASSSGPPAPTEDPDDPRTAAFRTVALARVATAKTVGELGQYHQSVAAQYGDQAWSDELTEAARARVAELDADQHWNAKQIADEHLLTRVNDCQSSHDLAQLWEEVTVGGSVPERWTDEVQRAAAERLEQIKASTPPAPSNPFA